MKSIICILLGLSLITTKQDFSKSQLYGRWELKYIGCFNPVDSVSFLLANTDTLACLQLNENGTFYATTQSKIDSGVWSFSTRLNAIGYKYYTRNGMINERNFVFNSHIDFISSDTLKIIYSNEVKLPSVYSKSRKSD